MSSQDRPPDGGDPALHSECGQTTAEYTIVMSIIVLAAIVGAFSLFAGNIQTLLESVINIMNP